MRTEDGARLTKLVADAMARLVGAPGSVYVGSHRPGLKIPLPRTMSASTIPLPQTEYESIYAKVPRLTVEVIVVSPDGVLLARRQTGPCAGLWHIPGGTVRFGEPLTNAVQRVADEELGVEVTIDGLLGYIEYPSHLQRGLDWPLGMAFRVQLTSPSAEQFRLTPDAVAWFATLPEEMHDEQKVFLSAHGLVA